MTRKKNINKKATAKSDVVVNIPGKLELKNLSTEELAYNVGMGNYNRADQLEACLIIIDRERKTVKAKNRPKKPRLPGSKAEKIEQLFESGKSASEVAKILEQSKVKITPSEIYRIRREM
jgi:hypothetical protein